MAPNVVKASNLRPDQRPIDPDVNIPEAVKRSIAAAEAAQKAAYPDQPAAPAAPKPPANADTIVVADPPAAPAPPAEPASPVTPPGNEPPPAEKTWPPEVELEMQRIRSAEGRRRAALEQQLSQAADRMSILENRLNELASAPPPAPVAPPAPPTRLVTEEEENNFGTEMLDVIGRRARETISPELAELRAMMAGIEQKLTGTAEAQKQTSRQSMLGKLNSDLPEWKQINVQPEFKAWLALPDPYFGVSRLGALKTAFEQNDTARVLNFFNGFVSELAASTPANDPEIISPAPPARPSLETLAAPGRARSSAQPTAPAEKQIITTADIDAFYAAVRKGLYNGREAEKLSLEQELFAAQREGRVRA